MGKLKDMVDRLRAVTPAVMEAQTLKILRSHRETATNMNTDQLFAGELANGQDMPNYSVVSVERFGKRPGPYQLYDKGDFYRSIFMKADKFPVLFGANDNKTPRIMELIESKGQNPDEIFGVNKANLTELARVYTLPDLQQYLREIIRLR
jgi:hypothetical protein